MEIKLEKLAEESIYFDKTNCYVPTSVKVKDPFNDKFKLTIVYETGSGNKDIPVVLNFKGERYLLGLAKNVPPGTVLTGKWEKIPTVEEFFKSLGEEITETTTLSLIWETGYMVSENSFAKTDELQTDIFVEVPKIDIVKYAIIGTLAVGTLALAIGIVKK